MDDLKPDSEEEDEEDFLEEMDPAFSRKFSDSAGKTIIGSDTSGCEMLISVSCWWLSSSEEDLSTVAVASGVGVSVTGLDTSTSTAFESAKSDMVSPKLFWHKIWSFFEFVSALSRDSVSDDDDDKEDPDFATGSFGTILTTGFPSESLSTRIKGVNIY